MRQLLLLLVSLLALAACSSTESPSTAAPTPASVAPLRAPASTPRDLGQLLHAVRERQGMEVPAIAAAIVSRGSIVAIGVDGVRELGKPEKVTIDDKWHLGSCSKAMAATMIAKLVEEGALTFETTCSQSFPDVQMDPAWRGVPLWLFLHHRSGATYNIPEQVTAAKFGTLSPTPAQERLRLVTRLLSQPPETKPGTTYTYSNIGYYVAAAMAEQATGKSWEDLMRERLFAPLGMTSAGFGPPGSANEIDQPRGHNGDGKVFLPGPDADYSTAGWPAGGIHASITDWAKFVTIHLRGERVEAEPRDSTPLLKPETFIKLHEPMGEGDTKYAAGWAVLDRKWGGGRILTHAGTNERWFSMTSLAMEKDFALLVVCNQGGDAGTKAANAALNALIQDYFEHSSTATPGAAK